MRPRKGGTLFGHGSDCYNWDNHCHCGSDQPLQLPPEETYNYGCSGGPIYSSNGRRSVALFGRGETPLPTPRRQVYGVPHLNTPEGSYSLDPQQSLHGYGNLPMELPLQGYQSLVVSRGQHHGPLSHVPQGRGEVPLLGHGPQCYQVDNRCRCSSSEPYRLPPETPDHSNVHQHLYYTLSSAMPTNSNPNTSSYHQSYIDAVADRLSSEDFGTPSVQHNQQTATHLTELGRPSSQYSLHVGSQVNSQSANPGHNVSHDLPPSYSELFPNR